MFVMQLNIEKNYSLLFFPLCCLAPNKNCSIPEVPFIIYKFIEYKSFIVET